MTRRLDTGLWLRELFDSRRESVRILIARHGRKWLPTFLLIFSTLFLYGLLFVRPNTHRYTVTYDIQVARTNIAAEQSTLVAVSKLELSRLVVSARTAGVIEDTVNDLSTTGQVPKSHIAKVDLLSTQLDGKCVARIRVVGQDAIESGQVARSVGSRFLRHLIQSAARPTNRLSESSLDDLIARESASWDAVSVEWNEFIHLSSIPVAATKSKGSASSHNTSADRPGYGGVRLNAPIGSIPDRPTRPNPVKQESPTVEPTVNVDWLNSEFRLRELCSERSRLRSEPLRNLAMVQRYDVLIAGAIADMRSIPMLLHAPGYVASTTYPPLADEVSGGKPRVESQKTDWIDLIINGQSQITPLLETHQNDRERLLERVRTLLPAAAPPVVVFGWADTAPLVQRWGRGMSSKTFVPLLLVCLSLSGLVTFCLYRLTAIECLHDLRELAALSQVQVIATVSTGVGRRPHDLSRFKHRTAAWIRRIFQMALLLYAMMFATALLTSVATGSLLPDPREALGQVFSIFSSFH
jgi:hypothetical protein